MNKNYQYFMKTNVEQYIGEWIAICNQKIVSHGINVKEVYTEAAKNKFPDQRHLLARIPNKDTMIFYTQ